MRNKFSKFLSLVLCLCMVLSTFVIFAGAETKEDEVKPEEKLNVIYNRDFEEGWDYTNGISKFTNRKAGDFRLDYQYGYDMSYNYYILYEAIGGGSDEFMSLTLGRDMTKTGKMFMEFDINASDNCNIGDLTYYLTAGSGSARGTETITSISNGELYAFGEYICPIGYEWVHLGYEIDWDCEDESDLTSYTATVIFEDAKGNTGSKSFALQSGAGGRGIQEIRFGFASGGGAHVGDWYGMDNLKIYTGVDTFTELPEDNYGSKVDAGAKKDFKIKTSADGSDVTLEELMKDSLFMKKNLEYGLLDDKRIPLLEKDGVAYGAPVMVGDQLMVPLERLLEFINYPYFIHPDGQSFDISTGTSATYLTVGRDSATVGGKRVELHAAPVVIKNGNNSYLAIALSDVEALFPGFYVCYDDMGLILISRFKDAFTRDNTSLDAMMDVMKKFVFDYVTPDEFYDITKKNTNNFEHPYIFANQKRFDELKAAYESAEDSDLKQYITRFVDGAKGNLEDLADFDENGNYLGIKPDKVPVNKNYEVRPDGYDVGGRLGAPSGVLDDLAFAYQITRDLNYVKLAYDWILALGEWPHWGQGHFLNCADNSSPVATAIDWMYPGMIEAGLDTNKVVDILYTHGVHMGYLSTTGKPDPFPRAAGNAFWYTSRTNNWNAVCSSGMVIASLAIMGETAKPVYKAESAFLASSNMETLAENGMGQYAPDGSYVESASYWAYGTNAFFKMTMALETACGTDFGFMDCWGIDKTCYFACQVEDSNFRAWSYHDGNSGPMDTSFFSYVGQSIGDLGLVKIRQDQVKNGKGISFWDVIFYMDDKDLGEVELDLQYYMEGIDGFSMRSSWEKDSMFAGIMGGDNACPHGQIDAGAFVYHNKGRVWIEDLGGDDYNVYGYWSGESYRYYRKSAEGNNTIAMTTEGDLRFGQAADAIGKIIKTGTNDFGTYAIIDNTKALGDTATYWRRGMMATNDRNTVIVQDEISLKGIQSLYWFAHYNIKNTVESIKLSADGRTAYLTSYKDEHGQRETLRIAIVSPSLQFKFEIMDCYSFVLGDTYEKGFSESKGGQPEKSRDAYNKLAIKAEGVLSFNLAVAIEIVDPKLESEVGYTYTDMQNWEPYADTRGEDSSAVQNVKREAAKRTDIVLNLKKAKKLIDEGSAYDKNMETYYRTLTDLEYACLAFKDDLTDDMILNIRDKQKLVKEYNALIEDVNTTRTTTSNFINALMG